MRHLLRITPVVVGCLLAFGGQRASAQQYAPPRPGIGSVSQPAYSPYLNLFRSGAPLYQNYFGLVRPELEWRGATTDLQQQVGNNSQAISSMDAAATAFPSTGHTTRFLSTGRYFLNSGQGGGGGGRQGGVGR